MYSKHLNNFGFEIIEATPNGGWFDYLAQEILRLPWIGRTYSSRFVGYVALIYSLPLILILRIMKIKDTASSEFCTFGWNIVALKKINY